MARTERWPVRSLSLDNRLPLAVAAFPERPPVAYPPGDGAFQLAQEFAGAAPFILRQSGRQFPPDAHNAAHVRRRHTARHLPQPAMEALAAFVPTEELNRAGPAGGCWRGVERWCSKPRTSRRREVSNRFPGGDDFEDRQQTLRNFEVTLVAGLMECCRIFVGQAAGLFGDGGGCHVV